MPVGVAVVDADRRLVLFNAAYHDSLDMPPNSFYRGMRVADALRIAAYRGVYGPGDPEAQIAAFLKTNADYALPSVTKRLIAARKFVVVS